jgi:L-fuconolactonase
MTVVDTHQHFWNYNPQRDGWMTDDMRILRTDFTPDDASAAMNSVGVSQCVAVQATQSIEETEYLLDLADRYPFICGVVGWVDLRSSALDQALLSFQRQTKLKGFRHILQSSPELLADRNFVSGVSMLGKFNFTYDLLIYYHQLDAAITFAKYVSDSTPIVVDHLAKPPIRSGEFTTWANGIREISQVENVYCKISGIITEADWNNWKVDDITRYIDLALETFGPSRLMYGSDWPVCLLAGSYAKQWAVINGYLDKLSDRERTLILSENAKRFYKL